MTDQQEQQAIDIDVAIGYDAAGDPMMRICMSEQMNPNSVLRPEQVRQVGVALIEAAARAEAGAKLGRAMMLDGAPPELMETVRSKMMM